MTLLFRDPCLAQGRCVWLVCWLVCTQNFYATNSALISQHSSWTVVRLLYFLIEIRGAAKQVPFHLAGVLFYSNFILFYVYFYLLYSNTMDLYFCKVTNPF